ncbi:hypothetical protein ACGFJ7_17890 [Actinoplanes sp. NPDC048988]|uniref:hypothetical protein n=1 Tax=Actinoplanes sp. NPDC048988 TaxID=3363901 RepID=UPI00371460D1
MKALLWALPAYGVLLGLSTLTHQPPVTDFDAYAEYVTTGVFLVSHLGASILGAALAILGAIGLSFALGPSKPALAGLVLTTIANVFLAATFGSAAFVQPGLGRAHLAGVPGMAAMNDDTAYGPALVATAPRRAGGTTAIGRRRKNERRRHVGRAALCLRRGMDDDGVPLGSAGSRRAWPGRPRTGRRGRRSRPRPRTQRSAKPAASPDAKVGQASRIPGRKGRPSQPHPRAQTSARPAAPRTQR